MHFFFVFEIIFILVFKILFVLFDLILFLQHVISLIRNQFNHLNNIIILPFQDFHIIF
jgi:hypothetical protein